MPWGEIVGWAGLILLGWWLSRAISKMHASWTSRWTSLQMALERDREAWARSQVERNALLGALQRDLAEARRSLTLLTDKQQADATLFVGSFLPDDQSAAEYERTLQQTEDRAIAAAGPVRFSSRPSPTSARPSRRDSLIQRPKISGSA